jgi:ketosteroid isomerase-like protein
MRTLIILLLAVSTASSFSQPAVTTDDATAAINTLRDGLVKTFTAGDVEGMLQYLDDEIVVTWQNGEVCRGRNGVREFYKRMMTGDKKVVREVKSAPEVLGRQLHGDVAVSWGNLHDHFILEDGSDLPFNSVFTATTARRGDRWLVTAFHTSANVFANPVVDLAVRKTALWVGAGAIVVGLIVGVLIGRRMRA